MRARTWCPAAFGLASLLILGVVACSGGGETGTDQQFAERAEALGLVAGSAEAEPVRRTAESESEADGEADAGPDPRTEEPDRGEDPRGDLRETTPPPDTGPAPAASSAGASACAAVGDDAAAIVNGGTPYAAQELTCLRYLALEKDPLAVEEFTAMQVAAIGLYNTKDERWQKAVEHALSYSELRHAPNLNFAGLKPAYDRGRYSTVISRANVVWNNLDKGYQLDDDDRTFVAEFACRSGVQLHMGGAVSADHDRWCRIWVDRLSREGKPTDEAQSLLEQVE